MREMKLQSVIFATVFAALLEVSSHGQAIPNGVLIDEFPVDLGCEFVLGKTDAFGNDLNSRRNLRGLILVYARTGEDAQTRRVADFINRAVIGSWGLSLDYQIVLLSKQPHSRVQFWLVPKAESSRHLAGELLASVPFRITKRYYFGVHSDTPCRNHIGRGFASVIKMDPNYVGQLVVYNVPLNDRAETAQTWLNYFREEHGLGRDRIRVFFKRGNVESFLRDYHIEFWIEPRIRR